MQATQPKTTLGTLGDIARIGFGCFGLSGAYGPADPQESISTLHRAFELGCQLFDTANIYGNGENERLVGEALHALRRQVVLATKVGFVTDNTGKVIGRCGRPDYLREAAERSLKRLRTEVIDLYTLHRVDPAVPLEDTMGAMADLVAAGKIRAIGLSEVTTDQLRRAHAVHPVSAVQSEYSLWMRDAESGVLPVCRELGIAFVAFSPLGRGLFAGPLTPGSFVDGDFRRSLPRFQSANLQRQEALLKGLQAFAVRKGCTPSQLALSWLLQQSENVFVIPGTRRAERVQENMAAANILWTPEDLREIGALSAVHQDTAARYAPGSPFAPA